MNDKPLRISEAFHEVCELGGRLGVKRICEMPGCWELAVDANWWIAVNGHREPTKCSKGIEVAPCTVYVEWCGWPAGVINPGSGVIAAGEAANEASFIEALRAAHPTPGGTTPPAKEPR